MIAKIRRGTDIEAFSQVPEFAERYDVASVTLVASRDDQCTSLCRARRRDTGQEVDLRLAPAILKDDSGRYIELTTPLEGVNPSLLPEIITTFSHAVWPGAATLAWLGYLRLGRGVLLVTWDLVKGTLLRARAEAPRYDMRYITQQTDPQIFAGYGHFLSPRMTTYDPRTSLVFGILSAEEKTIMGVVCTRPPYPADLLPDTPMENVKAFAVFMGIIPFVWLEFPAQEVES